MTPLVLDGSGDGTQEVAIITDGLPHLFQWTKSATNGPTGGTLSVKLVWDEGYEHIDTPETLSTLETNLTGANNDLHYDSKLSGTEGNGIQVEYIDTGVGSQALEVSVSGTIITVRLALSAGTNQVEELDIVEVPTVSGDLSLEFVSALTGTIPFTVALFLGDDEGDVAAKIKDRMDLIADITSNFDLDVSGTMVVMTAKNSAANDGTLFLGYSDGSSVGMIAAASTNTTAGVAPAITSTAAQVKAAIEAYEAANAIVTVTNKAGNDGTGVVTAMAAANLTGGVNQVTSTEFPESPFLDSSGTEISYDLSTEDSGGFGFKPVVKGKLVVSVSGGTAETVLFTSCTPEK